MSEPEGPQVHKPQTFTNFHKLILFGAGTLLCGTLVFIMTMSGVMDMMMRGRSGGGFMMVIGMTLAIGLQITGGTIIARCVSKVINPILQD